MVKRSIYLNSIEDLDLNNIGCHFTADLGYKHKGGGSNGLTNTSTGLRVDLYVKEYTINEEATEISNSNYPTEKEVVLEMNQAISVEVVIVPSQGRATRYTTTANTGTRADLWVKNL